MGLLGAVVAAGLVCRAAGNVIGIDYGTEMMKVALVQPGAPLEIVTNHISKRKTETALAFVQGERLFGSDAYGMLSRKPTLSYARLTELLGRAEAHPALARLAKSYLPIKVRFNATRGALAIGAPPAMTEDFGAFEEWSVEELVAMILAYAKDITRAYGGKMIRDCVITVPAHATQLERQFMLAAADLADLRVLSLIEENTAAAVQYGLDRVYEEPRHIVFYNLGAESAQCSIVRYSTYVEKTGAKTNQTVRQLEVVGKGWAMGVGGFHLDLRLAELIADGFNKKWGKGEIRDFPRAMAKIRAAAKKTKEVLSANAEIPVHIPSLHDDIDFSMTFTRKELEAVAEPVFAELADPIRAALAAANLTADDVDGVEIIGGGVRVPRVQATLKAFFVAECANATRGKELADLGVHLNGDEAVALGAAFHGANISKSFRVRKVGMVDHTPFAISLKMTTDPEGLSAHDVLEAEGKTGLLGGLFSGNAKEAKKAAAKYAKEAKDWTKDHTIFKVGAQLGAKPKSIAFQHDSDILCELAYDAAANLPEGTARTIALYNISGIANFVADMTKRNESGTLPRPKVQLSFTLDASGIATLSKAEVSVVEEYQVEVEVPKAKPNATNTSGAALNDTDAANATAAANATDDADADADASQGDDKEEGAAAAAEDAASPEGGEAASDGGKEAPETQMVTKKRTHKRTLTVVESTHTMSAWKPSLSDTAVSKARLAAIAAAEQVRIAREAAKNDLEASIYSTRTALNERDDLEAVSTEEQRDAIRTMSEELEEWLYDADGEEAAVFLGKKAELVGLLDSIIERAEEAAKRPTEVAKARKALAAAKTNATEVWLTERPWLNATDLEDLAAKVDKVEEWLVEKEAAQAALAAHETPAFYVADIRAKLKPVAAHAARLLNKPKPKPPAPKKDNATNATDTDTNATDTNATRPDAETAPEEAAAWDEL